MNDNEVKMERFLAEGICTLRKIIARTVLEE